MRADTAGGKPGSVCEGRAFILQSRKLLRIANRMAVSRLF